MATRLRRVSFFHLLWEKRNRTQEMSQTPWEAQQPLQGDQMQSLDLEKNGTKEWRCLPLC